MINIRAFRAVDDPESCDKFIEGHSRLLEIHFGLAKITSSSTEWAKNPNTIVLIVEDEAGEKIYGGARIQIVDNLMPLPIETAIGKYDKKIFQFVGKRTCEVCGMWNSIEVAGMGIGSLILTRISAAALTQLPVDKVYVLCAPITMRMGRRIGAIVDIELGNNGTFYYPKDDFIATALVLRDIETLVHAEPAERERIFDLRKNPLQVRTENGPKGNFDVSYDLRIANLDKLNV